MPRLIDADKLFEWIADRADMPKHWDRTAAAILRYINEMPTVDAEPVVRCKDCIYKAECVFTEWLGRNGNGFCSCGERKKMPRLIDADVLAESTCDGICQECNEIYKGKNVTTNCSEVRLKFLRLINDATTVDAIPIEWILNNEKMPKEGKGHDAIVDMIEEWRKGRRCRD